MRELLIPAGGVRLDAELTEPARPFAGGGTVVFAHGSGSSRHSPRNRQVAAALAEAGFATLLFDLLTPEEERRDARTAELRFDVPLLAERLGDVVRWLDRDRPLERGRLVGLFGASTGAAAALVVAARAEEVVGAVVSRGGRPDLAGAALGEVRAPTRLIVGGADPQVLALNERARERLPAGTPSDLVVVPGAGHLFEEPGALEEVARRTVEWFGDHLPRRSHVAES